jgi:carboxymethylenebutenolidase
MKSYLLTLLLVFTVSLISAQDFALKQLESSPRHHEWVEIPSGDRTLHAFVAYPEVSTNTLAVVVIHENAGLTDWVRSFSDQLAEKGFLVIAPDLLSSFDENHNKTSDFATGDAARSAIYQLKPEQVTQDLEAARHFIANDPSSNGKTAIMGFCWGGAETFRFVTNNADVLAGLVFYGSPPKTFEEIQRISVPVYGFYGGNDQRINSTIPETEEWMKQAGKKFDYVIYPGAGHGYMRQGDSPTATPANIDAKEQSWKRIVEVLEKF